jgi:hypothetical protein
MPVLSDLGGTGNASALTNTLILVSTGSASATHASATHASATHASATHASATHASATQVFNNEQETGDDRV